MSFCVCQRSSADTNEEASSMPGRSKTILSYPLRMQCSVQPPTTSPKRTLRARHAGPSNVSTCKCYPLRQTGSPCARQCQSGHQIIRHAALLSPSGLTDWNARTSSGYYLVCLSLSGYFMAAIMLVGCDKVLDAGICVCSCANDLRMSFFPVVWHILGHKRRPLRSWKEDETAGKRLI